MLKTHAQDGARVAGVALKNTTLLAEENIASTTNTVGYAFERKSATDTVVDVM